MAAREKDTRKQTTKNRMSKKKAGKSAAGAGGTAIAVVITVRANQVFNSIQEDPS